MTTEGPTANQLDIEFKPRVRHLISSDPEAEIFTFSYVCEYNNQLFDIFLFHKTLPGYDTTDSVESRYLQELEDSGSCEGDDYEDIMKMLDRAEIVEKEMEIKVLMACQPIMQQLAPDLKETPLTASLHSHMYPSIIKLQVVTLNRILQGVQNDALPDQDFYPPTQNNEAFNVSVPYYETSSIQYLAYLWPSVFKVSVSGQILCAKLTHRSIHDSMDRELKTLDEVRRANFDSATKVPRLRGIITSHTGVVGVLIDYIPSRAHQLEYLLSCAKKSPPPEAGRETSSGTGGEDDNSDGKPVYTITTQQKQKWARQIEHNLKSLHSRGIIWYDAKLSNVLIDNETDDAWVVDFGGGITEGWVDRALQGTFDGDLQALAKIKAALEEN